MTAPKKRAKRTRRPPGKRAGLSTQMKRFVEEYTANGFRGPDAARTAGYTSEGAALRAQVYKLLKHPLVRAAIDTRLSELEEDAQTRAGAIVERLAEVATFDPGEVLDFTGIEVRLKPGMLISDAARRCIKKLSFDKWGRPKLEFHDRVRADELLGKYRRLFVDRLEVKDTTLEELLDAAEEQADAGDARP